MKTAIRGLIVGLGLAALSACTVEPAYPGYVVDAPPPARVVVRPPAPAVNFVWIDGYWSHHYDRWDWHEGRWARPPHGRSAWAPGYWRHEHRGWVWIPGHWR